MRSAAIPIPTPISRPSDHTRTLFELNATQRLFQAFTGRTLKLFRAPFFGDAEPTTADEIVPVWEAQNRGYVSVGLHVDSEDWQRPGVPAIVNNVAVDGSQARRRLQRCRRKRSAAAMSSCCTIPAATAARPSPRCRSSSIRCARAAIASSRCRSLPAFPRSRRCRRFRPNDHAAARIDFGLFELLGFSIRALGFLFATAITLGIARAVVLTGLALAVGGEGAAAGRARPIDPRRLRQRAHPRLQRGARDRAVGRASAGERATSPSTSS